MEIFIKTLKGKNINIDVEDSSNTIDLKIHGEPIRELALRLSPRPHRSVQVMKIFLKTLSGKTFNVEVEGSNTIGELKAKYAEIEGIPVGQQMIIFEGQRLKDSHTVAECGIKHESTIVVYLRLCGC